VHRRPPRRTRRSGRSRPQRPRRHHGDEAEDNSPGLRRGRTAAIALGDAFLEILDERGDEEIRVALQRCRPGRPIGQVRARFSVWSVLFAASESPLMPPLAKRRRARSAPVGLCTNIGLGKFFWGRSEIVRESVDADSEPRRDLLCSYPVVREKMPVMDISLRRTTHSIGPETPLGRRRRGTAQAIGRPPRRIAPRYQSARLAR